MVFQKCRKFGISLNPKKYNFGMEEGRLLGHIISKEGIKIDPSRVEGMFKHNLDWNVTPKIFVLFVGKIITPTCVLIFNKLYN
jgi:hypothetical protein